jgi:hypothetical protein
MVRANFLKGSSFSLNSGNSLADLELKGASALEPQASIEVLVARLADLAARSRGGGRGGSGRR